MRIPLPPFRFPYNISQIKGNVKIKMDKSLSIMLKMREKIRVEEPKCFRFGVCYISVPFASSVKASRYTSRIRFAALSIISSVSDSGLLPSSASE